MHAPAKLATCVDGQWTPALCSPFKLLSGTCPHVEECIASPGWPERVQSGEECEIEILDRAVIGVTLQNFSIQDPYDRLEIAGTVLPGAPATHARQTQSEA